MRLLAFICASGISSAALASFELALVMQSIQEPNSGLRVGISRWDPVSRTQLGHFFVPGYTDLNIALNPGAAGTVDTFGRTSTGLLQIRRFNYGNGLLDSTINTSISVTALSSVRYLSSTSMMMTGTFTGGANAARIYSTAGTLTRNFSLPAFTLETVSMLQDASGITYVLTRQAGTNSGSKYTVTSHAAGSSAIADSVVVRDDTPSSYGDLMLADGTLGVRGPQGSSRRFVPVTGTSFGTVASSLGWAVTTNTMALGHGDMVHGFGYDDAQTRMVLTSARLSGGAGDTYTFVPTAVYGTIYDSAIVVAPEPGTLLALGAAVGVLLRRRRKSCPN